VRLFVALDLREDVRQAIRDLIARLQPAGRGARWVRPEGMHITLKFIGHVDEAKLGAIGQALEAVDSPQPVDLRFRGVGFFPNERRPRVIWCGIEASKNLPPLASDIENALQPVGIQPESREFVPHLTLARFSSREGAPAKTPKLVPSATELVRLANELESQEFGSARETDFHLFESTLHRSGAEYRKLASYRFVKDKTSYPDRQDQA
jgi:2'-5' RNA ligase